MAKWQSGFVEVKGGCLAYHRTGGPGPSLVLSHGFTDNGLCWSRLAAALEGDFDIIMLDARGHGQSTRMSADAPYDAAEDLAAAISALGLAMPVVMGHSVGGRASAAYANAHLGQVAKVVLEDPAFAPMPAAAAVEKRRERFRKQVETFHTMTNDQIIAMGKAQSPKWHDDDFPAWAASKLAVDPAAVPLYLSPWQGTIDQIDVPTLIVHGDPDLGGMITADITQEARSINPNITTVMINGAGHNTRRENFTEFLKVVKQFLLTP